MTTIRQMRARIRRFRKKPAEIHVPRSVWLGLVVEMAARHPQATPQSVANLRRYGYAGMVFIDGVRLVEHG